jgi:hypothetical protein
MTSPIDVVLGRLDRVARTGKAFKALCPGHGDKTPSLSIKECGDGRVLLHCFGGCTVDTVVAAMGLQMSDLFVADRNQHSTPKILGVCARDLRAAAEHERRILYIVKADQRAGRPVSVDDMHRAELALNRISKARRIL